LIEGDLIMRRIVPVLAAVAAMFLGTGVAAAAPVTYEVPDSWQLTYIDGRSTVLPEMEDDSVEVKCLNDDQMTDWKVNNKALVAGSGKRVDGTGIWVQPNFTGKTETLTITVSCERR
jgi:hypothetical protein